MDETWGFNRLVRNVTKDKQTCIDWCKQEHLLPTSRTCSMGHTMSLDTRRSGLGQFRCRRGHNESHPFSENTWFSNAKVEPHKAITLTYCFAQDMSYDDAIKHSCVDDKKTSSRTVADWYANCREIVACHIGNETIQDGQIGGPGEVVEIDEAKFGKRKYNRGRVVEGAWLIGMVERGTGRYRVEICPDNSRSEASLKPLILRHVAPWTTIMTDCWSSYNFLTNDPQFAHLTVNHSTNFVDPITGAHTQNIESSWRPFKKWLLKTGVHRDHLSDRMMEYLFRRRCRINCLDTFDELLKIIREFYPIP